MRLRTDLLDGHRSDGASDDLVGRAPRAVSPAAALAHDLRSPLAAVIGFARLVREDLRAGDPARAALLVDRIERSAAMLEAMLASALDEHSAGGAAAADLHGVLEQVRAERKGELERRGIRLLVPGDAPAFAVRQADLYRVVSNLVGNAIDHMGDGLDPTIAVSVCRHGARATLRVSDNGGGIAPERRERVFEVANTRCTDGTQFHQGFGLAIVRELAASWGGHAWVEAAHAPGATLCVTIPVAR